MRDSSENKAVGFLSLAINKVNTAFFPIMWQCFLIPNTGWKLKFLWVQCPAARWN